MELVLEQVLLKVIWPEEETCLQAELKEQLIGNRRQKAQQNSFRQPITAPPKRGRYTGGSASETLAYIYEAKRNKEIEKSKKADYAKEVRKQKAQQKDIEKARKAAYKEEARRNKLLSKAQKIEQEVSRLDNEIRKLHPTNKIMREKYLRDRANLEREHAKIRNKL